MVDPKPHPRFRKQPSVLFTFFQLTFVPVVLSLQSTYGTTEVPLILRSVRDSRNPSSTFMRPIDNRALTFVPISSSGGSSSTLPSAVYKNVNTNVLELVIPATSPDCPHPSVRQLEDGHFHTGDLFLEVVPGHYTLRSRMCEWIRSSAGLWYDAKYVPLSPCFLLRLSVEDNWRANHTCVVLVPFVIQGYRGELIKDLP